MRRSCSNLVMVWWFLAELCLFHFENNMKFLVSVHYHPNGILHSTQTWHLDASKKCQVKFKFGHDFKKSYAPFTLKIIWNFQFPFITSLMVVHIQLKFDIYIHLRNKQFKFKFGHGSMILDKVISLEGWKKKYF
jgi:hypothetical protein